MKREVNRGSQSEMILLSFAKKSKPPVYMFHVYLGDSFSHDCHCAGQKGGSSDTSVVYNGEYSRCVRFLFC